MDVFPVLGKNKPSWTPGTQERPYMKPFTLK
jgi:hypothetical protein